MQWELQIKIAVQYSVALRFFALLMGIWGTNKEPFVDLVAVEEKQTVEARTNCAGARTYGSGEARIPVDTAQTNRHGYESA